MGALEVGVTTSRKRTDLAPRRLKSRRADLLFDYPLPIPHDTVYQALGVGPEATDDDLRRAVAATRGRLESERKAVDTEVEEVFARLPDLRALYRQRDALEPDRQVDPNELRRLQSAIAQLERKAIGIHPRFKDLQGRAAVLGQRIVELNRLSLEKPEERQKYDTAHPPLALMKVTLCTRDEPLNDRRVTLALLRHELSRFLEAKGEPVLHPSDLTRTDFSADFTPTALLDDEGPP